MHTSLFGFLMQDLDSIAPLAFPPTHYEVIIGQVNPKIKNSLF